MAPQVGRVVGNGHEVKSSGSNVLIAPRTQIGLVGFVGLDVPYVDFVVVVEPRHVSAASLRYPCQPWKAQNTSALSTTRAPTTMT